MKMNAGIWIGIIGGIGGFLAGVVAVITTAGPSAVYIVAGMVILFGGMGFLFYKLFFGPMFNMGRLQKTGIPGTAKILKVSDTGVTINNNPQVKLLLEVKNNYGQVYNTVCRMIISRLQPGLFQPGMQVLVKIDPKNEKNVIVDFSSGNPVSLSSGFSQPGVNVAALKTELEELQQQNDAIKLSGHPAKAIIKNYRWLGAYINGNNPYVELDLEILPENATSFSGKVKGVISEASVEKFQPGKEIFVKYDLYDNSKITIDHSL
jgi:hypothetical protein